MTSSSLAQSSTHVHLDHVRRFGGVRNLRRQVAERSGCEEAGPMDFASGPSARGARAARHRRPESFKTPSVPCPRASAEVERPHVRSSAGGLDDLREVVVATWLPPHPSFRNASRVAAGDYTSKSNATA